MKERKFEWKVCPNGGLECNEAGYDISPRQLVKDDWLIMHMMEKTWVDMNEFLPAYFQAMGILGLQERTIRFFNVRKTEEYRKMLDEFSEKYWK